MGSTARKAEGVMGRLHTDTERERGMIALVMCGGNLRKTSKFTGIPTSTLNGWRKTEEYQRIRAQREPQIVEKLAAEAEEFALQAAPVEQKMLDKLEEDLDKLGPADLASALRNVSTSKAINIDKISSPLRGRPTVVIEHRSIDDIAAALEAKLRDSGITIDSTADEIIELPSAELQED